MKSWAVLASSMVLVLAGGCATARDDATTCPVHNRPLESELVILRNGQGRYEYQKAREKDFPFSGTVFTNSNSPMQTQQHGQAKVCQECRRAEMKWNRDNLW